MLLSSLIAQTSSLTRQSVKRPKAAGPGAKIHHAFIGYKAQTVNGDMHAHFGEEIEVMLHEARIVVVLDAECHDSGDGSSSGDRCQDIFGSMMNQVHSVERCILLFIAVKHRCVVNEIPVVLAADYQPVVVDKLVAALFP